MKAKTHTIVVAYVSFFGMDLRQISVPYEKGDIWKNSLIKAIDQGIMGDLDQSSATATKEWVQSMPNNLHEARDYFVAGDCLVSFHAV